jgi:hypothetical protein
MIRKSWLVIAGIVFVIWGSTVFSQTNMKVIQDEAFQSPQRPPAVFVHDEHNMKAKIYDCSICHHVYQDGKKVPNAMSIGQGCSDCHKVNGDGDNPIELMDAYHQQCIECHQEQGKGPLTCGECHVRP